MLVLREERSRVPNLALRAAREAMGWSQQQVAGFVGTNAFTVCRWERGQAFPSPHYRQELCRIFGKSPDELGLLILGTKSEDGSFSGSKGAFEEDISALTRPLAPLRRGVLVGREGILTGVRKHLLQGRTSMLCGFPGIGKTSLAVELAGDQEIRAQFPDGILWARLRDIPNILALLQSWARSLGLSASEVASLETISRLRHVLKGVASERKLLFVLDDVRDIDSLLALSIGGVACGYLVTSRLLSLAVQFAQEGALVVPELDQASALRLLAQHAPTIMEHYPEQAKQLADAVGGHPLALTLMGRHIYSQAFSGHPRRIQSALTRLQQADYRLQLTELVFLPDQMANMPYSLRTSIMQSVSMLSKTTQAILRSLAVFPPKPATFTEKEAQEVCGVSKETVVKHLDTLVDAGLLANDTSGRYALHPVLRDYVSSSTRKR